jgi:hypothetical protein
MITKLEFLLNSAEKDLYNHRWWLLATMSVLQEKENTQTYEPYLKKGRAYILDFDGVEQEISDYIPGGPLLVMKEEVDVKPHAVIPNLKSKVKTTYGRLLTNLLILTFPFKDKYPYVNEAFSLNAFTSKLAEDLRDDKVTVDEVESFFNQSAFLSALTSLIVPAASEKSITTDPRIAERRKELIKKYEGRLEDPAIISKIEQELIALDREWIKGDVSEGFYKSSKAFNITRKKMLVTYGGEQKADSSGKMSMIPQPLKDGWEIEHMPNMFTASRMGSYGRGMETALGGEAVKVISRTFQNSTISTDDCKDKVGIPLLLDNDNYRDYVGRYLVGSDKPLDADKLKGQVGKTIRLRSPMTCKVSHTDFCARCMGDIISSNPQSLSMLAVQVGSSFLGISMSAVHGRALLTTPYEPSVDII